MLFRLVLLSLIVREVQAQPASCVTCVSCQDVYDGTDNNSTCSSTTPNANSCQKMRIQLPGTTLVAKACSKSCNEQTIVAGPIRLDVSCCTTTNCNISPIIKHEPILFTLSAFLTLISTVN